jgi:hypothetical protein
MNLVALLRDYPELLCTYLNLAALLRDYPELLSTSLNWTELLETGGAVYSLLTHIY